MAPPQPTPTPSRPVEPPANVYAGVYRALFWGMLVSTVLFALGVASALWRAGSHAPTIPLGAPFSLGWTAALRGLIHLDPTSLMLVATVLLILTPVARVVVAFAAFARDRDGKFTVVTGIVLAVIVLTVILGRLGLH